MSAGTAGAARVGLLVGALVTAAAAAADSAVWISAAAPAGFVAALAATWIAVWAVAAVWSRAPAAVFVRRLVAVHLAVAVTVLILELPALFGLVDYRLVFGTQIIGPSRDPRFVPDAELVYRARPRDRHAGTGVRGNIAVLYDVPDRESYAFHTDYDDRGFRNAEAPERADVVVIGDSFVHGCVVPQREIVTTRLEELVGARVYNCGQVGYGPNQEGVVLRRYALPMQPRVVVWAFCEENDLGDVRAYREWSADPAGFRAARHGPASRSFVRNAAESLQQRLGVGRPSALPGSGWYGSGDVRRRVYFIEPDGPATPDDEDALAEVRNILADAAQRCAARGCAFVLAFIPSKFRACGEAVEFEPGSDAAAWRVNDLPERIRVIGESLVSPVEFVDLTPALAAAAASGDLPYLRDDTHWSAAGHRAAAAALAPVVERLLCQAR